MDYKLLTGKQDCLNRLMKIRFAKYFEDFDLTAMQALTLEYIIERGKYGDVFPKDLDTFLSIRSSSVTSLINNLETLGYVKREPAGFDGRYKCLVPTAKAKDIIYSISARISEYTESLFVGITEEELKAFETVIEKMIRNTK